MKAQIGISYLSTTSAFHLSQDGPTPPLATYDKFDNINNSSFTQTHENTTNSS